MRRLGIKDLPRIVLGLYVFCMLAGVSAFGIVLVFSKSSVGSLLGLFLVATGGFALQVAFVWGCGVRDLCRPIGRRRLLLPVSIGALLMAQVAAGVCVSLGELFRFSGRVWYGGVSAAFILTALAVSCIAFVFWARRVPRFGAMGRMGILILVAAVLEIMTAGVTYPIVGGRPDCGLPASVFVAQAGAFVLAWAAGVGIVWLFFLLPRYLEEKRSRESAAKPGPD